MKTMVSKAGAFSWFGAGMLVLFILGHCHDFSAALQYQASGHGVCAPLLRGCHARALQVRG